MTDVSANSLKRSFDRLSDASPPSALCGAPGFLLRFYAAECGLKAMIMKNRKYRSTAELDDHLRTHDLTKLAKELRLSPGSYDGVRACRRRRADVVGPKVPVQDVHEAWRYGARLDDDDEKAFVNGLNSVIKWCGKELR